MIDITVIIEAVVALILALITTFLIPWIKTKVEAEKLAKVNNWVKIAVKAAEMIYTEVGQGVQKKDYVLSYLEEKGYTYDAESINLMIEAAVLEMKTEGAERK